MKSEVLIFEASGQEVLRKYLDPWLPEVLHLSGEQINVPLLLASLFRRGRKFDAYLDIFIGEVRPRIIVTFIDNHLPFYSLSLRHPSIKTLFIQNGYRSYYGDSFESLDGRMSLQSRLKVDFMMTFGTRIGAEYAKHIQGIVEPMGSLKNNLFCKVQPKKLGSIAFLSQYRSIDGLKLGGKFYTQHSFFKQTDQIVLGFLLQYAQKNNKKLFIVPCMGQYRDGTLEKEQMYFNSLLNHSFDYSEWRWLGSGYDAVDTAEVVVSIDSTLAYESAARGNKTAFFSIRSALIGLPGLTYGWPEAYPDVGPYWTNLPETAIFERILNHLFSLNDEQWAEELSANRFTEIMAYNPGNSILRSVLLETLGAPPQRQLQVQASVI